MSNIFGPYLCLHTELIGKAFLVLQQPALRVLQLLHLYFPVLHHRQRGRALLLSLLPSLPFPLNGSCPGGPANSGTWDKDPHCLHLCAGLSTHLAQVEHAKRLGRSSWSRMGIFWAAFWTSHLQEGKCRWTRWHRICVYLQDDWRFFSFHAIASTSDRHFGRICMI